MTPDAKGRGIECPDPDASIRGDISCGPTGDPAREAERAGIARTKRIEEEVASRPGVALAGAAYHGIGMPQCIAAGETAAHRVLMQLRNHELGTPAGVPS